MEGEKVLIKASSLNFSGINTSPFQYNDGSQFVNSLNKNYQLIKEAQFPELTKWVGVSLDKHFKNNRFSIQNQGLFMQKLKDKLFSKEQFTGQWSVAFHSQKNQIEKALDRPSTKEQQQSLLQMDYSFYRAVVMTVYQYSSLEEYEERYHEEETHQFKNYLVNLRKRPPFQLDMKEEMTEKYYKTVDLMFLQQAGTVKWQQRQGFSYAKNHDSVIIYRTQIFGKQNKERTQEWSDHLDINNDTAIVFTENNYLLISSHFTAKNPQFKMNAQILFKALTQVLESSELNSKLKVIVGMDANHFIAEPQMKGNFKLVPYSADQSTTNKKRTFIQAQLNKADKPINEVKDHLLTNIEIESFNRIQINGQKVQQQLLPNDDHPFDHFIVAVTLSVKD